MNPQPFFSWHLTLGDMLTVIFIGGPVIWGAVQMKFILTEFRPHRHSEKRGPLTTDGIEYPRSLGKS